MKCQRCLKNEEAQFRVHNKKIDVNVCAPCAKEAQQIGIRVELIGGHFPVFFENEDLLRRPDDRAGKRR